MNDKIKKLLELNISSRRILMDSLKEQGISDFVINAMDKIPREYFINFRDYMYAYDDKPLPINYGQTISQPYTVGFMSDLLELKSGMNVLEIGTGSGYQALILSKLGARVFTIERISELYSKALTTFLDFEEDIQCFLSDGTVGLEQFAPFDRIIVTAGSPSIPESLKSQLKIGGIMVIPVGSRDLQQMLKLKKISEENFEIKDYSTFKFVPLIGNFGWKE